MSEQIKEFIQRVTRGEHLPLQLGYWYNLALKTEKRIEAAEDILREMLDFDCGECNSVMLIEKYFKENPVE